MRRPKWVYLSIIMHFLLFFIDHPKHVFGQTIDAVGIPTPIISWIPIGDKAILLLFSLLLVFLCLALFWTIREVRRNRSELEHRDRIIKKTTEEGEIREKVLEENIKRLSLVNKILRNTQNSESVEEIVIMVVSSLHELFPYYRTAYSTLFRTGTLHILYSQQTSTMPSTTGMTIHLPPSSEFLGDLRSQEIIKINSIEEELRLKEATKAYSRIGTAAMMYVPVTHSTGILGVLSLESPVSNKWSEFEEAVLRDVSDFLGVAIKEEKVEEALARYHDELEAEVSRRTEVLERTTDELLSFAYVISHDFKAPLRGISNITSWLREELVDCTTPGQQVQLSRIQERAKQMHEIIESLLEYSRIGRNQLRISLVDVNSVLDSVMLEIATAMQFSMERTGDFPTLRCDGEYIRRVFFELIQNAVQYGGPNPLVRVTSIYREKDRVWEFSVVDSGKGIPLPYRDRIFQLFQTLERNSNTEGKGLGLALVKKILRSAGGRIWLESAGFDGGSVFRFTWPAEKEFFSLSTDG